jgi:pyridoxine 4-dehydrogenase
VWVLEQYPGLAIVVSIKDSRRNNRVKLNFELRELTHHHFFLSNAVLNIENVELEKLVSTACKSNAAFFDTAERYGSHYKTALGMGYGETEKMTKLMLGRVGNQGSLPPVTATKFTPTPWRSSVQSVVDACKQSAERLGVEQIDLYQVHMPDIVQPFKIFGKAESKDEIYWDGLAECYNQGLVKNVGVCNYGPTLTMRCQDALAKRGVPLASNQIAYSLIGRHNGAQETLEMCNDRGIKVMASFPFAMGLLTGKYSSNPNKQLSQASLPSLYSNGKSKLEQTELRRYAEGDGKEIPTGGIAPLHAVMERIAQSHGKTVAQVALNYIICKGAIPIPGSRTNAQVVDNIGAMGWRLTDEEVGQLELVADSLGFDFEGAGFKRTSEKFVGYGTEKWRLD